VAKGAEGDDQGEVDPEEIKIIFVKVAIEPSDNEVIGQCQDPCTTNGVVGSNICHDGELTDIRSEKFAEEGCEGPSWYPESTGLEQQFVASICVFLPAVQFVVDGQGDTFFEAFSGVRAETNCVPCDLETQGQVEILRYM